MYVPQIFMPSHATCKPWMHHREALCSIRASAAITKWPRLFYILRGGVTYADHVLPDIMAYRKCHTMAHQDYRACAGVTKRECHECSMSGYENHRLQCKSFGECRHGQESAVLNQNRCTCDCDIYFFEIQTNGILLKCQSHTVGAMGFI